jgi:pSer/pThr/pTyr-binding forkhead associated (FHA) protein
MQAILHTCLPEKLRYWLGSRQSVSVGSVRWADVVVCDPTLSGVHFRLETRLGHCWLRDLDSRNGTRVNGVRVFYAELQDGDEICAGDTRFIISLSDPTQPVAYPAPHSLSLVDAGSRSGRSSAALSGWQAAG